MQRRLSRARWAGQVKQNLDGRREVRQSLTPIRREQSRNESAALCNEITGSPSVSISPQRPPTHSLTDRLTTLMRAERYMDGGNKLRRLFLPSAERMPADQLQVCPSVCCSVDRSVDRGGRRERRGIFPQVDRPTPSLLNGCAKRGRSSESDRRVSFRFRFET